MGIHRAAQLFARMAFSSGREAAHGALRRQRLAGSVEPRKNSSAWVHLAERRRWRKLARLGSGIGKRKSLDTLGAAAPPDRPELTFLRHGRRRARLRFRRAHQRKWRIVRESRSG